ncbi:MAG: hypothetical protein JW712_05735 [Dehalococcoidales bacterium]|nr:hypothetical protein [Dehalococcoidales bacterium]
MAEKQYANYIRRGIADRSINESDGPIVQAVLDSPQDWSGIGHRIDWKYITGAAVLYDKPHSHDYEEFLVIMGNNPADPRDFDAEIEITMGEEGEKHTITGTTVVCIPAGFSHGPLTFKRVGKPIVFANIYNATEYREKSEIIKESAAPKGVSKYGHYLLREPRDMNPVKNPNQVHGVVINNARLAKAGEFHTNYNFYSITGAHMLADPPHDHTFDEFLFLIPADYKNWPELGGEVEIGLGTEWEKQTITTAAVICIPKAIQHCPVFMKKVDKPFYWGHCVPSADYGYTDKKQEVPGTNGNAP